MLKTGFRGERKGILTPSLSKGEGECRDEKLKETSSLSHTPLSRGTYPAVAGYLQRGNVVMKNQKKPPPSPLREGECSDGKEKG